MKTVSELYQQEGAPFLNRLHYETGVSRKYLYHLATRRRRPSPEMALRLVMADKRLSFERLLLPDLLGDGISRPLYGGGGGVGDCSDCSGACGSDADGAGGGSGGAGGGSGGDMSEEG